MLVTWLTFQSGIAPYTLSLHIPSIELVDKQVFIAVWKLESVIAVWVYPNIEMNTSKKVSFFISVFIQK